MKEIFSQDNEPPLSEDLSSTELILEAATTKGKLFKDSEIVLSDFNIINSETAKFRANYFPHVTDLQWNSWKWQIQNSYTSFDELSEILDISDIADDVDFISKSNKLPLRITPYYASLFDGKSTDYPLIKSVVPSKLEFVTSEGEEDDPLHEEDMCPSESLVHRYPDRVLMLSTGFCSVYCRYCTRSRMATKDQKSYGIKVWKKSIEYIRNNPAIRDIVISGVIL